MWKSQLKNTTIPTMRTNLRKPPVKPDTGDKCNKKLEHLYNVLKNYNLLLKERWESNWPAFQQYYEVTVNNEKTNSSEFVIAIKNEHSWGGKRFNSWRDADIHEVTDYKYNPIPEPIACKALEILEVHAQTDSEYGTEKEYEFNGWKIYRDYNWDYQRNLNSIKIVDPQNVIQIHLSWANGEDNGAIYPNGNSSDSVNTVSGEHNIYRISGYYDARNFGFTWHEK